MSAKVYSRWYFLLLLLTMLMLQFSMPQPLLGAGATHSLHIVKYAEDGMTVLAEKTVDYKWMEKNLRVYGDGKTHYYHQGPIFEGDLWDPAEMQNLKDKGAVKGSAVQDLCDLVGGMAEKDEVMLVSVDNWHTEFAYRNIYQPLPAQGVIAICWFNGEEADEGERYGVGYPANNAYGSAMQIVFMSEVTNRDGKPVFGNSDMKLALPQERYQHFFEGQYPSTNGLSGKWISEVRVYSGGVPANLQLATADESHATQPEQSLPWLSIGLGLVGLALVGWFFWARRKAI